MTTKASYGSELTPPKLKRGPELNENGSNSLSRTSLGTEGDAVTDLESDGGVSESVEVSTPGGGTTTVTSTTTEE